MNALAVGIGADAVTRPSCVLALCGFVLLSASCAEEPEQSLHEGFSDSASVVSTVRPPTQLRAIDSDNLVLQVLVDGEEILRNDEMAGETTVTHQVEFGSDFVLTINWYERHEGSVLQLASLTMPFSTLGAEQRIEIDASDYDTSSFDDDRDGVSNLSERVAGTDPRAAPGDTFSFRTVQTDTLPIGPPAQPLTGDFDGDGMQDLVWSHLSSGRNEHVVHRSNGDGTFELLAAAEHPMREVDGGWDTYSAHVGDFDNDGFDDLAFVHHDVLNIVYLAYSNGNGTFRYSPEYQHEQERGWTNYIPLIGNFDGMHGDDIVFNRTTSVANDVHLRVTSSSGALSVNRRFQAYDGNDRDNGWEDYDVYVANVDGNADDLVWNALREAENAVHVARFNVDASGNLFDAPILTLRSARGFSNYRTLLGNIDGINGADIVFVRLESNDPQPPIHRNISLGNGLFDTSQPFQNLDRPEGFDGVLVPFVIDVNGDGMDDVLLTAQGDSFLQLTIALGTSDGSVDFIARSPQTAPDQVDWSTLTPLTLDVDGDGDQDLVYVSSSESLRLYVGIARDDDS